MQKHAHHEDVVSGELRRRDGEDQVHGKALGRRRGAGWQGGAEGGNTRCVEAPKWQKEKVEKERFFMGLPAERSMDLEWDNQAANWEQTGGRTFSPSTCGLLCYPVVLKKGLQKFMDEKPFTSY